MVLIAVISVFGRGFVEGSGWRMQIDDENRRIHRLEGIRLLESLCAMWRGRMTIALMVGWREGGVGRIG